MALKFRALVFIYIVLILVSQMLSSCVNENLVTNEIQYPCKQELDHVISQPISAFEWSEDSSEIYFSLTSNPYDWKRLELDTNISVDIEKPNMDFSEHHSPNLRFEIQLLASTLGSNSTSTPDQDGEKAIKQPVVLEVYVLEDQQTSYYLGQINGVVQRIVWSKDSSRAIIIMDYLKPTGYYVHVVDVKTISLTSLFQKDIKQIVPLFGDLSPDGNQLIYAPLYADTLKSLGNYRIFDLDKNENVEIPISISPWVWFISNDAILVLAENQYDQFDVHIYYLQTGIDMIYQKAISPHLFMEDAVQLSPDKQKLAFVQRPDDNLYILNICPNK